MRLINTIEVEPGNPKLERLEVIKEKTWLVDINTINEEELIEILQLKLAEVDLDDFEEQVSPIRGGIALDIDRELHIVPMCCGDIGGLREWEEIPEAEPGKWIMLWVGHPWVYYRRQAQTIEFSDYCETTPEEDIQPLITISTTDFLPEIARVRSEQDHFQDRIRQALIRMRMENSEQMAAQMTG